MRTDSGPRSSMCIPPDSVLIFVPSHVSCRQNMRVSSICPAASGVQLAHHESTHDKLTSPVSPAATPPVPMLMITSRFRLAECHQITTKHASANLSLLYPRPSVSRAGPARMAWRLPLRGMSLHQPAVP